MESEVTEDTYVIVFVLGAEEKIKKSAPEPLHL